MILQSTMYQKQNIDLSSAPWTMHEFFAGSGLVAYGLRGMFTPVWANDISEQKAAVYEANFGCERFILDDINRNYPELSIRNGVTNHGVLTVGDKDYNLDEMVPLGKELKLYVAPLYKGWYMKKEIRS